MRIVPWLPAFLLFLLPVEAGADGGDWGALFEDHTPLELTITAPMRTLMRDRPEDEDLPAQLSWTTADGETVSTEIGVRTRGNYRRQPRTCPFAPLRLNFKTSRVEDTIFAGQDKLKLVTHCKNRSRRLEQVLFREYLTYRMLNALTPVSYRVRPLQITYVDSEGDDDPIVGWAFVIESAEQFAERHGFEELKVPHTTVASLDPAYTNLTSVFQYLIGNTDYSPIAGPPDDDCCHNTHLYRAGNGVLYPVPYDFDFSGMVDAPYAAPNPKFRLRSVRQRLYRGRCANNAHIPASIAHINEHRAALYALVNDHALLNNSSRRGMTRFLDSYFDTVSNPRNVESRLVDDCAD